uniref:Transposase IS701-like DDE domain-containing protein n=1 Tax=uncultured marine bacterium 1k6 TaxID=662658 RepID=D2DIP6_9BACT|nr:conserved hypothetical protein [uncultured marine bacterium 1k6]
MAWAGINSPVLACAEAWGGGRKLPGVGWRWHSGEGRVAWGQQLEVLSVLDLDEHCSYPVHGGLQEATAPRSRRSARRSRPPRAEVTKMLALLDEALAVAHRPDIDVFVGDGHYACEPMVTGLAARDLVLVSKLRRDAALWVPWTEPPTGRPGRPRKYAGRFDRSRIGELPLIELPDEGPHLYHAQLYYKPFRKLLRVVFVLDADADPAEETQPTTLFSTDPDMAPERIYRIYRDRFQIEFNFRDAKQHLGLAACQARTAERHHFHVNAVLAALTWTRLELRHAADRALARFSMANVKLKSFLEMVLQRLFDTDGLRPTLQKHTAALQELLALGQIEPKPT